MIPRCVRFTGQTMGRPRPGCALQTRANRAKLRPRLSTDIHQQPGVNRFATSETGQSFQLIGASGCEMFTKSSRRKRVRVEKGRGMQNHANVRITLLGLIISPRELNFKFFVRAKMFALDREIGRSPSFSFNAGNTFRKVRRTNG